MLNTTSEKVEKAAKAYIASTVVIEDAQDRHTSDQVMMLILKVLMQ